MNFFSEGMRRNPYSAYDQMRTRSPVYHDPQSDLWMIFDYESAKRVLADHDVFSSRHGPADWLIFLDPPNHARLRAIVVQTFAPRTVASLEPRICQLSQELLDQTIERGEMDLVTDYSATLPMLVIAEMLGVAPSDRPQFMHWNDVILNMSYTVPGGAQAAGAMTEFVAVTAEMSAYVAMMLQERRAAPKDDLLTRLADAEVDGARLTHDEILGFFQLLLLAGSETTTNLISNAILCFLENPDQLANLERRIELLPGAIEEVLRYRSPLQWVFRVTARDVEMHGQNIPAGKVVLAVIGSANRDPKQFDRAEKFDITRDPNPHLAFGHGLHFCLGASLARLEATIALADLLQRLKDLQLASSEPWEPRKALHVHGPAHLPIRFKPGAIIATPTDFSGSPSRYRRSINIPEE